MKSIKYLGLFILPILVLAQADKRMTVPSSTTQYDGSLDSLQGCVLEMKNGLINFEEAWMSPAPGGVVVIAEDSPKIRSVADLRAPFWAVISICWIGEKTYIKSIRMLQQFDYGSDGYVIGEYKGK